MERRRVELNRSLRGRSEVRSMVDLKNRIWDYLYRLGEPQQITLIAEQLNETPGAIQLAVEDPWFDVQDGWVAIARSRR